MLYIVMPTPGGYILKLASKSKDFQLISGQMLQNITKS